MTEDEQFAGEYVQQVIDWRVEKFGMVMLISDKLLHDSQLGPCDIANCPHCPQTATKPASRRTRLRWWWQAKVSYARLRLALAVGGSEVVDRRDVE